MSKNFDDFKKSYLNNEIPNSIDDNINNILNNLPNKRRKDNSWIKKVASIILVLGGTVIFLFLSSEKVSASLQSLFKSFQSSGSFRDINENNEEYSEELNYEVENNGYKMKINDVIFTQKGLIYTYTLDKGFFGAEDIRQIEKMISISLVNGVPINKLMINNKEVTAKSITGYSKIDEDSGNIIGYQNILLDELNEDDKIQLQINEIGDIKGNWNLNFEVNLKVKAKDIFVLEEKIEKKWEEGSITVEELISTPMFTYVVYTLENNTSDLNLKATIVNENGRDMNSYQSYNEKREELSANKVRISNFLEQDKNGVKEISFIPTIYPEVKKSGGNFKPQVFIPLNTKTPLVIDQEELGKVIINSIEEKENKIFINCDVDGINKDTLINNLFIATKTSEEALNNPNIISNFNPIWMDSESYDKLNNLNEINNITISFTKEDNESYVFGYDSSLQRIKLIKDLSIKIEL